MEENEVAEKEKFNNHLYLKVEDIRKMNEKRIQDNILHNYYLLNIS